MKIHLKARNFGYNITQVLQVRLMTEKNSNWHLRYLISNFFKIILNLRMIWLIPMTKYFKNGSVEIHFCTSRGQSEKNTTLRWFEGLRQKKLSILWFSDGTGANGGEHCGVQAKWDDQVLCFYHRSYKPGDMIHGLNKQQYGLVY